METLKLIHLLPEWLPALREMAEDYRAAGENRHDCVLGMNDEGFYAFLRTLEDEAHDEGLPAHIVPQTTYWVVRNDSELIGSVCIRHRLNKVLEHEGGHIGMDIRPSERGKGYGEKTLLLALEKAALLGLEEVLITCDADDQPSINIIEKNGGVLKDELASRRSGKLIRHYWTPTGKPAETVPDEN